MNTRKKGFSLIEVLLAMAISLFIILGAICALLQSLNVKNRVELRDQLYQVISAQIEGIRHEPSSLSNLKEGKTTELIVKETGGQKIWLSQEVKNLDLGLKEIKISAYPQSKPALKTNIIFYFSQDLGF